LYGLLRGSERWCYDAAMPSRAPKRPRTPPALLRARFPPAVLEVLATLDAAGHRSWLVGGAVRDLLLRRKRASPDYDVATPARPEQVTALFRKVVPTGIAHGTVTVIQRGQPVEVTTFRGEGAYVDGRRPSSVTFLDDVEADLARRDFTVNAFAYDPLGRTFRDPFGGQRDMQRKRLRAVGDPAARFAEDGLRPLRAARFAAQLGFALDPATAAAIPAHLSVTAQVSAERVAGELSRLLVAPHARHGLALLDITGLLGVVLPELAALPPGRRSHAFEAAAGAPPEPAVRWAALLHALAAQEEPAAAARRVKQALERLRLRSSLAERAAALVGAHGCLLGHGRAPLPARDPEIRRWIARVSRPLVPDLLALWQADARALRPPTRARRAQAQLRSFRAKVARVERGKPPLTPAELALDGRTVMEVLGIQGGPEVGKALRALLERVLDDPRLNTSEALASELQRWRGSA
jgi:tRNA nucleotidyltransferase (CCA-adding enzyme)